MDRTIRRLMACLVLSQVGILFICLSNTEAYFSIVLPKDGEVVMEALAHAIVPNEHEVGKIAAPEELYATFGVLSDITREYMREVRLATLAGNGKLSPVKDLRAVALLRTHQMAVAEKPKFVGWDYQSDGDAGKGLLVMYQERASYDASPAHSFRRMSHLLFTKDIDRHLFWFTFEDCEQYAKVAVKTFNNEDDPPPEAYRDVQSRMWRRIRERHQVFRYGIIVVGAVFIMLSLVIMGRHTRPYTRRFRAAGAPRPWMGAMNAFIAGTSQLEALEKAEADRASNVRRMLEERNRVDRQARQEEARRSEDARRKAVRIETMRSEARIYGRQFVRQFVMVLEGTITTVTPEELLGRAALMARMDDRIARLSRLDWQDADGQFMEGADRVREKLLKSGFDHAYRKLVARVEKAETRKEEREAVKKRKMG